MTAETKLAKSLLLYGTIETKLRQMLTEVLSKYIAQFNDVMTRANIVNDVRNMIKELEEELGIPLELTEEKGVTKMIYHINFLDKKLSFTVQL